MAGKETSAEASVMPMIRPASSCGNRPLGVVMNSSTVSPMVAAITSSISQGWRSVGLRVRRIDADDRAPARPRRAGRSGFGGAWSSRPMKWAQSIGVSVSDTTVETTTAIGEGQREFAEEDADEPRHEQQRDEDGDQRRR